MFVNALESALNTTFNNKRIRANSRLTFIPHEIFRKPKGIEVINLFKFA